MRNSDITKPVGFGPVARDDASVLILGSLPGKVSLERGEYYAHSRNVFWAIMEKIFGIPRDLAYPTRLERLKEHRIALWDVCASARRPGSPDSRISNVVTNDFNGFFRSHGQVKLICFNGGRANKLYCRGVLPDLATDFAGIRREQLPSTSPAYAAMPFEKKLKHWREVINYQSEWAPARAKFEFRISSFAES